MQSCDTAFPRATVSSEIHLLRSEMDSGCTPNDAKRRHRKTQKISRNIEFSFDKSASKLCGSTSDLSGKKKNCETCATAPHLILRKAITLIHLETLKNIPGKALPSVHSERLAKIFGASVRKSYTNYQIFSSKSLSNLYHETFRTEAYYCNRSAP